MAELASYRRLVALLETFRDEPARAESAARFARALSALNRSQRYRMPEDGTVLIAGTNGKGSVAKTLETLSQRAGHRTGLYTSPHMMQTTERIRTGGADLTPAEFVAAHEIIAPFAEGLSHFETLTLMMTEVFFGGRIRKAVERAVIEVGVGGRLDPTRLIPHGVSVVTRLGLDHQAILGPDIASIAREKFAIVDTGNHVISAPLESGARSVFDEVRARGDLRSVHEVTPLPFQVDESADEPRWMIDTQWGKVPLAMKGERAVENTSVALKVLEVMHEPVASLKDELSKVSWPCRMEGFFVGGRRVYLSGDHNPQGIASLIEILSHFKFDRVHMVVGIGAAKDASGMVIPLVELPGSRLYLTRTPVRGASVETLMTWRDRVSFAAPDPGEAFLRALEESTTADLVVITGSLYLTGEMRRRMLQGEWGAISPIT